jgi:hypothetical protein
MRRMRTSWRRVGAVVAVLVVAGCSSIPTGGPVVVVENEEEPSVTSPGRVDPAPPTPGSTPRQIVRDFMDAMQAYPVSTDVADQYLTEDAADSWEPAQSTVVYESADFGETPGGEVEMQVVERARLGARGSYLPRIAGQQRSGVQWRLTREAGEWRITNPPDALYVGSDYFEDYYDSYDLYFLDPSQTTVVAEPAYFPSGDQLATNLVRALLAGPSPDAAPHVRTAIPANERLEVAIPVGEDGVAEVRLTGPDEQLSELQTELLSVQVVTTLRQVPGVVGVRIIVNEKPLDVGGTSDVQDVTSWDYYDPAANRVERRLFALVQRRLVTIEGAFVASVDAPIGQKRQDLQWVVVQESTQRLLGVSRDGERILSGPIDTTDQPLTVADVDATDLGRPTLDRTDAVAVVDRTDLGSSLVVVDELGSSEVRRVSLGSLSTTRVERFSLSPDGTRFLAVVAPRGSADQAGQSWLVTGWVNRGTGGRIAGVSGIQPLTVPGPQLVDVRDAGWAGPTSLVVLGRFPDAPYEAYTVDVDGSDLAGGQLSGEPLPEELDPVRVATAGIEEAPVYVGSADGTLWVHEDDGEWRQLDAEQVESVAFAG